MDKLRATNELFGDCLEEGGVIYIGNSESKRELTADEDEQVTNKAIELQTIYDNNQYQRDRNYAPTGDQLDMLWHSIDAGEFGDTAKQSEFYTANKAVKDANPKG